MNSVLKVFIFCCGILFSLSIVSLLLKKRINERNSIAWLLAAICILVFAANPEILNELAEKFGISYPPSLLYLFSNMTLLLLVLYQSTQISILNEKLKNLTQYVALLKPARESRNINNEQS
ncbi:DUF2304 domain-containing protein [Fodinisporobacter ferrooxydans]|uniref:DUF2304 domain-containing protein n=1 Tax=Fodinisporobacter ferrooxydans TaxID=2901836 RepID=A0ABY4CFH6_9BACL|nr:DUF2304 domain-containing protein [Alicyclobacillaceae bacterium MYW30-H2]